MSGCKFCARVRRWLGMDPKLTCEAIWRSHWQESDAWDVDNSNHSELWWEDTDDNRALIEAAIARQDAEPEAAFRMFQEAAEAGSPYAMELVAWHYDTGSVVAADFAQAADHYCRAINAGSWMATVMYARLLAAHDYVEECEEVLQGGIELDFVPASYWLAWLRYERSPTRETCREIRPLLDYAAGQGHPGAKNLLGRLMTGGKFGLLAIPKGFKLLKETLPPILKEAEAAPADRPKAQPLKPATQE